MLQCAEMDYLEAEVGGLVDKWIGRGVPQVVKGHLCQILPNPSPFVRLADHNTYSIEILYFIFIFIIFRPLPLLNYLLPLIIIIITIILYSITMITYNNNDI